MQKAGEPENDAGFPKHNYSQLNCSCYSYPSKPTLRLQGTNFSIFALRVLAYTNFSDFEV